MRITTLLLVTSSVATVAILGCQADGETGNTNTTSSSSGTTNSGGGTGGSGGSGGSGGTISTGGQGGTGGMAPDPCNTTASTHLLINEIGTGPSTHEFIEIYNPGSAPVDLSDYFLSDNSSYYGIANGDPWNPPTNNPGSDFLTQFPPSTSIAAGALLTIEFGVDFETAFGSCPDLTVRAGVTCNGNAVPQMVEPTNGGIGSNVGSLLSNGGEMAMLFCWGPGHLVHDVDYVNWDADADPNTHADKTSVAGYQPDTSEADQRTVAAPTPAPTESIGRSDDVENGETLSGGNGLLGHDETSENFAASFSVYVTPTPGAANQ